MKYIDRLASYLPSIIVASLTDPAGTDSDPTQTCPMRKNMLTACMFADVSGFTQLSEAMTKYGPEGPALVAKHLNSYFQQMVKTISSQGGDIFKFAGDAVLVLWPENDNIEETCRRAVQCAISFQQELNAAELADGVVLSVKVGIGVGQISILHMGGVLNRLEYVAVGDPLVQAFQAEHHAVSGEVIVSPEIFSLVKGYFTTKTVFDDKYVCIEVDAASSDTKRLAARGIKAGGRVDTLRADGHTNLYRRLLSYVPGAIGRLLTPQTTEGESLASELRQVTVVFVNLGLKNHDLLGAAKYDDAMNRCHQVLVAVQSAVYQYEGSLNKFLMDDKGSTLLAVWGLPPLAHDDDPVRAVMSSLLIAHALAEQGFVASIGVSTGVAFCGLVGNRVRREYSVLGDMVNLSARLMQYAGKIGGGVVCEQRTMQFALSRGLHFEYMPAITVKGKSQRIQVYRPYPRHILKDQSRNRDLLSGLHHIYQEQYELLVKYRLAHSRPTMACFATVKPARVKDAGTASSDVNSTAADHEGNGAIDPSSSSSSLPKLSHSASAGQLVGNLANGDDPLQHLSPMQSKIAYLRSQDPQDGCTHSSPGGGSDGGQNVRSRHGSRYSVTPNHARLQRTLPYHALPQRSGAAAAAAAFSSGTSKSGTTLSRRKVAPANVGRSKSAPNRLSMEPHARLSGPISLRIHVLDADDPDENRLWSLGACSPLAALQLGGHGGCAMDMPIGFQAGTSASSSSLIGATSPVNEDRGSADAIDPVFLRDAVHLQIPVGSQWSPAALHEHVVHFCFDNGLLIHGGCETLAEALREYALHIKGTDFFLPRAQSISVSSPSAAKAVGSQKPQHQSQTKELPATWMQHFCNAVLLYERNVVGLEGDSLFQGKSELRVTVAHSSQWAELQSYQGYAAQAIWELQANFFRRVAPLWNTATSGGNGRGESSDDVFVDCISGHDELPCEGYEASQDEDPEGQVSSNDSSARSFSPRALGAPSARAWEGAVVVLEGPIGCGKSCILTHALETFTRRPRGDISQSNADMLTKLDTLSLCAGGDPFYRTLYLGVWRTIVMNFLSEESRLRRNRGQVCHEGEVLQALFREQYPLLCPWLPVLAQLLPLGAADAIPDTDESRALPAGQASAKIVRGLLVAMLRMIADIRPTVIAIDDAQYIDPASWDVALDFATNGKRLFPMRSDETSVPSASLPAEQDDFLPAAFQDSLLYFDETDRRVCSVNMLLLIATRPLNHFIDVVMPALPKSYRELREDMALAGVVQQFRIGPLCRLRVRALVDSVLQDTVARRDAAKAAKAAKAARAKVESSGSGSGVDSSKNEEEDDGDFGDHADFDSGSTAAPVMGLKPSNNASATEGADDGDDSAIVFRGDGLLPFVLADDSLVELIDQLSCGIPVAVKELVHTMAEDNSYGALFAAPALQLAHGVQTDALQQQKRHKDETAQHPYASNFTRRITAYDRARQLLERIHPSHYFGGGRHFQRPDEAINVYVWAPADLDIDEGGDDVPRGDEADTQLSCPLPLAFYSMYGMRIDRLLMRQQLELKVASNIGQRFKVRVLEEVLVKEGLTVTCQTLMADLKSMEMQGVIRETRTTFGDMASMDPQAMDAHRKRAAQSAEFAFCDPCMRQVVLRRMLKESQRDQLRKKIHRYDNKFQDNLRKEILLRLPTLTSKSIEVPRLQQFCRVQKNTRGTNKVLSFLRSDWKRRLVRLGSHGDEIIIYRDQEGKKLAQRALLTAARINHGAAGTNLSTSNERGRHGRTGGGALDRLAGLMRAGGGAAANGRLQTCLSIHVQTWFQGDEEEPSLEGARDFNIELNSSQDLQQWTYWIQFCIDRLDVAEERKKQLRDTAHKAANPKLAHIAMAAKKNAILMNSDELQSIPVAQQWNEAWRQTTNPNTSPRNCVRLLLGNVELLPAVWGGDEHPAADALGIEPYRRRYAMHANNRPMLYCVVQHGGQEWSSRIVDQAHLPIWEEGVCMELRAHADLHSYGPGGDFGLAPTELRVCVYAYSEFASGQLLATASVDLRTVSDRSPSRSSVKDGNGEEVQLPPNIASWCSVAEAEGNSAFHVLPMQTVADAPASASAVVSSDAAAAASAFMSRRMLNIQTDSASDSLAEYHDWKNGSETNAGSIATRPTGFLKCCLWLSTADADVRDAFSPGLPSRLKKPMAATPTKTRRGPANDRLQALRGNIDNFSLSVDTQPISDMRSYSLGSPTTQSYASAPSTMRGFALHGEDQGQLETQSQDSLSGVFPSARALLQWQINKIRDGGAWSLDDLERMLHNTDTNGAGTPRASSAQIAHSARASVSGHKRAESLTAGLLERSASVVEFEAQRQSARQRIQERRMQRSAGGSLSAISDQDDFPAVLDDHDGNDGEASGGEDFPAVNDSDQSLEVGAADASLSPDRRSGSPMDFPAALTDADTFDSELVDAAGVPFVGSVAEGDPDDLAARRRSSVAAARAAVASVPDTVKESMFTYSDAHGVQQGPFTAVQICEWYHAKLIDGRVRLRPHFPARGKRAAVETSALTTTEAPFSPVHRAGNLYVADVVGDVYLRERVTWGMRALLLPSDNDKAVGNMLAWDFDPFLLDNDERVSLVASAFALMGFVEQFRIPPRKLLAFATKVAQVMGAHRLPYHNFVHAVDVFQSALVMLVHPLRPRGESSTHPHGDVGVAPEIVAQCAVQCMGAEAFFEPLDVMALLIAALMHDLDHPGLNNAYQIAAATDLAVRYNDQSVLENHHIAIALSIITTDAFSILEGLSAPNFDHVRRVLIETILATDMARHGDITAQFAKVVERVPDHFLPTEVYTPLAQKLSNSQKLCIMRTLVHAADVSNPTKPWTVAKRWSDAITEEFYAQGDKEAAAGMPVSAGFDRSKHVPGKSSLSFSDFVVIPMFEDLRRLIPRAELCIFNIRENRKRWKEDMKAHAKAKFRKAKEAKARQTPDETSKSASVGTKSASHSKEGLEVPLPQQESVVAARPLGAASSELSESPGKVYTIDDGVSHPTNASADRSATETKKKKKKRLGTKKKKDDLSWMKKQQPQ